MAKKLEINGFNKKALALFNFYMRNRTQQVQIGNALSDKCPVKYGVPQGSIPGPLLFMWYINDLPLSISNCNTDMYADDSTMHISGKIFQLYKLKFKKTWIELNYGARIIVGLYIVVRLNVWQLEQSKNLHSKMNNYLWLLILSNFNIQLVKNYLVSKLTQI